MKSVKIVLGLFSFVVICGFVSWNTTKQIVDQAVFEEFFKSWAEQFAADNYSLSASTFQLLFDECQSNNTINLNNYKVCNNIKEKYLPYSYYFAWEKYMDDRDYDSAKFHLLKSAEYNIKESDAYFDLWYIEVQNGNYNAALDYFKKADSLEEKPASKEIIKEAIDKLEKYLNKETSNNNVVVNTNTTTESQIDDSECWEWLVMNEEETECVKDTKIQREKNCKARYWNNVELLDNLECDCKEWYKWNNADNACILDISQKSRVATNPWIKDANCTNWEVIYACNNNPLWDECPTVCLELKDAINWMYDNWLTIFKEIDKFWVYNEITREQASKFFVQFNNKVIWKSLTDDLSHDFSDIWNADPTLTYYIINSNYMWLFKGSNWKFMPFNQLTKWQAIAVIIRMVKWYLEEPTEYFPRYYNYLMEWEKRWLFARMWSNFDTLDEENVLRWEVALMLHRLYLNLEWDWSL